MTAVLGSACAEKVTTTQDRSAAIRVINASNVPFDVLVDGAVAVTSLGVATISAPVPLSAGAHEIGLRVGSAMSSVPTQTLDGQTATIVGVSGGLGASASVLVDTGSVVPAGKSKLRVVNLFGGAAPIEIWRTQPDYQTPIHIMTPFAYLATSPYLQSDPGGWEVFVTSPGSFTKVATTGTVPVPAGERRTVVLLDSTGVMKFRVITE